LSSHVTNELQLRATYCIRAW